MLTKRRSYFEIKWDGRRILQEKKKKSNEETELQIVN